MDRGTEKNTLVRLRLTSVSGYFLNAPPYIGMRQIQSAEDRLGRSRVGFTESLAFIWTVGPTTRYIKDSIAVGRGTLSSSLVFRTLDGC